MGVNNQEANDNEKNYKLCLEEMTIGEQEKGFELNNN